MTRGLGLSSLAVAAGVLVAHLVTMPRTLEDIDSINLALGVEYFDVARHQPHPPGYPVYVGLSKLSTAAIARVMPGWGRDRTAAVGLAVWSAAGGALALWCLVWFWTVLGLSPRNAVFASALSVACPLFWFTASRPLTDVPGLAAGLAAQAGLLLGLRGSWAGSGRPLRLWLWASAAAGLAVGIRSQTMWLTGPLILWVVAHLVARRQVKQAALVIAAGAVGTLIWFVPLVIQSGGLGLYVTALGGQGTEDFAGVRMLATQPSWLLLRQALADTFVAPWVTRSLARGLLALAVIGTGWLVLRNRRSFALLLTAYVPYLAFHLAFQETPTVRYALPLVVPISGLAVLGLSVILRRVAWMGAAALVVTSLVIAEPRLVAYSRGGAPIFRLFQDMLAARAELDRSPVVRMHHQVWWGVRRAVDWYRPVWDVGPQPFPGDAEWLDWVSYWRDGGSSQLWLLADRTRTDIALVDPRAVQSRRQYRWPPGVQPMMGGLRLDELDWITFDRPAWMLGRGWALTPEVGGITEAARRGAGRGGAFQAVGWIKRAPGVPVRIMIGGRHLRAGEATRANLAASLDERPLRLWSVGPDQPWFVEWISLPDGVPAGPGDYARLTVDVRPSDATLDARLLGLEQFDAADSTQAIVAFLDDWGELESNPETGQVWRWTGPASTLVIDGPAVDRRLVLIGESPLRYFDEAPTVRVRAGDRELGSFAPGADFIESVDLPAEALSRSGGRVTIETDRTFAPVERGESQDRRRLGLRLFEIRVEPRR